MNHLPAHLFFFVTTPLSSCRLGFHVLLVVDTVQHRALPRRANPQIEYLMTQGQVVDPWAGRWWGGGRGRQGRAKSRGGVWEKEATPPPHPSPGAMPTPLRLSVDMDIDLESSSHKAEKLNRFRMKKALGHPLPASVVRVRVRAFVTVTDALRITCIHFFFSFGGGASIRSFFFSVFFFLVLSLVSHLHCNVLANSFGWV